MVKMDIPQSWQIRYSKYIGDLTLFDDRIYQKKQEELVSEKISDDVYFTFDKKTGRLMMVEIGDAKSIIPDIDNMDKSFIINKIKEYILCPVSK